MNSNLTGNKSDAPAENITTIPVVFQPAAESLRILIQPSVSNLLRVRVESLFIWRITGGLTTSPYKFMPFNLTCFTKNFTVSIYI
jgi:hypothetical protein